MTDDYAPELAIPIPDPVGRCYRKPGSKPLEYSDEGKLKLPPKKKYYEFLEAGIWVPSITNIIGLRNRPYLQGWAAKLAVEEAIEIEKKWPGYLLKKRHSAVKYLKQAGDRNRDAAGLQGSIVHDMLEKYALGEEVTPLQSSWDSWILGNDGVTIINLSFCSLKQLYSGWMIMGMVMLERRTLLQRLQD